jgi:hypothetical protein
MANLFKPIKSFLTVVIFLVLIAVVAVVYGGGEAQQARMEDNIFYQKSRLALDTIWGSAQGLAGLNLNKNLGVGDDLADQIRLGVENNGLADGLAPVVSSETSSAWSGLFNKIKTAWQESESEMSNTAVFSGETIAANPSPIFIDQTDTGHQLVLQAKSGKEYRINWPFKKK